MHNTVTVDEAPQKHGPGQVKAWESTDTYDLADAQHALYDDLTHRRRVIFVKPDYYVLIDDLTGKGQRNAGLELPVSRRC